MRMNEELCILLVFPRLLAGRSLSGLPCTYCKEKIDGTDEGFVVDEILIAFPGGIYFEGRYADAHHVHYSC